MVRRRNASAEVWGLLLAITLEFETVTVMAAETPVPPRLMEVFTSAAYPITNEGFISGTRRRDTTTLVIHAVDGLEVIAAALSAGLPATAADARAQALARMRQGGLALRRRVGRAVEALEAAARYGLAKYPAIVFDEGESVIYGVTDIAEAYSIYLREARRQ